MGNLNFHTEHFKTPRVGKSTRVRGKFLMRLKKFSRNSSYGRKNRMARTLATAPKPSRTAIGNNAARMPAPKLINWWSPAKAQPVGRQSAMGLKIGGAISSGHQHPPSAPISRLANTH